MGEERGDSELFTNGVERELSSRANKWGMPEAYACLLRGLMYLSQADVTLEGKNVKNNFNTAHCQWR